MKKKFLASLATGMLVLGLGGMAQALTVDGGTDVGGIDTLINETMLANSGDATELAWVTSILGAGWSLDAKYNTTDGDGWFAVDGANMESVFAHALLTAPDYFLIKTGNNSGNTNTHFLFQNFASMDWAVIDLADMGFDANNLTNIDKISYISEYNGDNGAPVPEPMTMLLMGTGLAGLVGIRRKMKL